MKREEIFLTKQRKTYLEQAIAQLESKQTLSHSEALWISLYRNELQTGVSEDDTDLNTN